MKHTFIHGRKFTMVALNKNPDPALLLMQILVKWILEFQDYNYLANSVAYKFISVALPFLRAFV